jgi:hypothetical protein
LHVDAAAGITFWNSRSFFFLAAAKTTMAATAEEEKVRGRSQVLISLKFFTAMQQQRLALLMDEMKGGD